MRTKECQSVVLEATFFRIDLNLSIQQCCKNSIKISERLSPFKYFIFSMRLDVSTGKQMFWSCKHNGWLLMEDTSHGVVNYGSKCSYFKWRPQDKHNILYDCLCLHNTLLAMAHWIALLCSCLFIRIQEEGRAYWALKHSSLC